MCLLLLNLPHILEVHGRGSVLEAGSVQLNGHQDLPSHAAERVAEIPGDATLQWATHLAV